MSFDANEFIPIAHADNSNQEVISSVVTETDTGFRIAFLGDVCFTGRGHLFHHLRGILSSHFGGRFLSVKYAALVTTSEYQVIHDPFLLKVYLDPLAIFRDATAQVNRDRVIHLLTIDSQPHYFRPRTTRRGSSSVPGGGALQPRAVTGSAPDEAGGRPGDAARDVQLSGTPGDPIEP